MNMITNFLSWLIPNGMLNLIRKSRLEKYPYLKYEKAKPTKKKWKEQYARFCKSEELVENWVLYESHCGVGMACNPLAIFKAFMERKDFNKYIHIWVIKDKDEYLLLKEEYKKYRNVIFTRYCSRRYAFFLAKCKYLINNTSFNPIFSKREGQMFVNTWHSITVKSLGYDTPDGPRIIKNMLRAMLQADYVISPNKFMTKIYDDSFRLRDIYEGKYIEEGYPRNDLTLTTKREEILKKLENRGTTIDRNKKVILYAPTWSGNNANNPTIDMSKYTNLLSYLSKNIDLNEYQILIKPHPVVYRRLSQEEKMSGIYVSYTIDANELLSIVDILITDYSSIYFDYLVAKKPILFYIPDYENYQNVRGIYFKLNELPGPCSFDLPDLANNINNIKKVEEDYKKITEDTRAWACERDNGRVSHKILDIVIDGKTDYNILSAKKTGKKTILMYISNLMTNGVTSAALSMLKSLDYDKYDVTVFVLGLKYKQQNVNFDKIPHQVRTILRVSAPCLDAEDLEIYKEGIVKGLDMEEERLAKFKGIMKREYERIFGSNNFDYVIDFFGYGSYFTTFALLGGYNKNAKKFIWQHSDMKLDLTNKQKKKLNNNNTTLKSLIKNYTMYDKIVSSTKEVGEINKKQLSTDADRHKYTYVTNMLDEARIEEMLKEDEIEVTDKEINCILSKQDNGICQMISIPYNPKRINFATMGRCMPEKNHENIIRAIKQLVDKGVDCALYIIGDGHLKEDLEELSCNLGISDRIFITGILENPLALLKRCNCFVFPSLYEAQGLAVLEARVVGLPIIVSNYDAVHSVLLEDKQYILKGTDVDSICEGMQAYIDGKISNDYKFDVAEYNNMGKAEWDKLLES